MVNTNGLEWKRMEWKHKGKSFLLRHQQRKALVWVGLALLLV